MKATEEERLRYVELHVEIVCQEASRLRRLWLRWMRTTAITHEDLIQTGFVGLLKALAHFDETRGVPFSAYARRRIRGEMLDALNTVYGRFAGRVYVFPLEDEEHALLHDPSAHFDERILLDELLLVLTAREREVISAYLSSEAHAIAHCAARLKVTQPRLSQIKAAAIAKMRRTLTPQQKLAA